MSHSPKVLAPGEEKRVIEEFRRVRGIQVPRGTQVPRGEIMEIEGRYLLSELKNMARTAGISHLGDKEQLCRRLIEAGIIS